MCYCLQVEKLDTKLRSLSVCGLDNMHLAYSQFFPPPPGLDPDTSDRVLKLVRDIGCWHQVRRHHAALQRCITAVTVMQPLST